MTGLQRNTRGKRRAGLTIGVMLITALFMMFTTVQSSAAPRYAVDNPGPVMPSETGGLYLDKSVSIGDDGKGEITLETYVEGSAKVNSKPLDIVLVLDQSGSMMDDIVLSGDYVAEPGLTNAQYMEKYGPNAGSDLYYKKDNGYYSRITIDEYYGFDMEYVYSWTENNETVEAIYKGENSVPEFNNRVYRLENGQTMNKRDVMKGVVGEFITKVARENSSIDNADLKHRVAVVGFADGSGESGRDYRNTEILTLDGTSSKTTGVGYRDAKNLSAEQLNSALLEPAADREKMGRAVDAIEASGATSIDNGMELARMIVESDRSDSRKSIVIALTDGIPTSDVDYDPKVANKALEQSNALKSEGNDVYALGLFDPGFDTLNRTSTTNKFMNYLSSNYPQAMNMDEKLGDPLWRDFYSVAKDRENLDRIFDEITAEIQSIELGPDTIVKDVMSQYTHVDPEGTIKMTRSKCTGFENGKAVFGPEEDAGTRYDEKDDVVKVNGFDFDPVIDLGNGDFKGSRLTVVIPFILDEDAGRGNDGAKISTNNKGTAVSALVNGNEVIHEFPVPEIKMPEGQSRITIKPANEDGTYSKVYDGKALSCDRAEVTEGQLRAGDIVVADSMTGNSVTDAGSSTAKIKEFRIMRGKTDVTSRYTVTTEDRTLEVKKRPLAITGENAEKTYSGTLQKAEGIETEGLVKGHVLRDLTYLAEGTDSGTYEGAFSGTARIDGGTSGDVTGNYEITKNAGKLKINPVTDRITIDIKGKTMKTTYDGTEKSVKGYEVTEKGLYKKEYVKLKEGSKAEAKGTDRGDYPMGLEDVDFENTSDNFTDVRFNVTDGNLAIDRKALTFTGQSGTRTYDGTVQKLTGITPEGLAAGNQYEGLTYKAEGKDKGTYDGAFSGTLKITDMEGNDVTGNYKVDKKAGKLTIDPVTDEIVINVEGNSLRTTYDGTEKSVKGYKVTEKGLYEKEYVKLKEGSKAEAKGTDHGEYPMGLKAGDFENISGNFTNVKFEVTDGGLAVAKRDLTLTGESGRITYDGDEHSLTEITPEGIASGEEISGRTYLAKGTDAGDHEGAFSGTLKVTGISGRDVTDNYDVTEQKGKLTIDPVTDEIVIDIAGKSLRTTYDGTEKSVKGYEVTEKGLYKKEYVKLKEGSKAEAKGTDRGDYPMGLEDVDFENTSDNFTDVRFNVTDGNLAIDRKTLTFTGQSGTRTYDGTVQKLTGITPEGLAAGHQYEGLTYKAEGKDKGVYDGAFSGTLKITDMEGNDVTGNYKVDKKAGKLTIDPVTDEIVINVEGNSLRTTYDGTEKSVKGYEVTEKGLYKKEYLKLKEGSKAEARGTDRGDYPMGLKARDFENTSENFTHVRFNVTDGNLAIDRKALTLTGQSGTRTYDGTVQKLTGITPEGLAAGHQYEGLTYEAKGKDKGTYDGVFSGSLKITDAEGRNVTDNYHVTEKKGKLTIDPVTDRITVVINGDLETSTYDGKPHKAEGYRAQHDDIYDSSYIALVSGEKALAEGTDAGTYHMGLDEDSFTNTSANFTNVVFTVNDGKLMISRKDVLVGGESSSATYNGQEQEITGITAEGLVKGHSLRGISYRAAGTDSGEYEGAFSGELRIEAADGSDVTRNYKPAKAPGTLTIDPVTDDIVITVMGNTETKTYNGQEQKTEGYTVTEKGLYRAEFCTTARGVKAEASGNTAGTYHMGLDDESFVNTSGNFTNVTFDVTDGSLVIDPADVIFTGQSDERTFSGSEQKLTGITADGLMDGHTYEGISYEAKGTDRGGYDGAFSGTLKIKDADGNDVTGSYDPVMEAGKLTIKAEDRAVIITVTGKTDTVKYDGQEHSIGGYTVDVSSDSFDRDLIRLKKGAEAEVKGTDAGTYLMGLQSEDFESLDTNFSSVVFMVNDGSLVITPREITFTSDDADKKYDGKPLTDNDVKIGKDGFADGEGADFEVTGSRTDVGESENEFTYTLRAPGTKEKNYSISTSFGTLTVTKGDVDIIIQAGSASKIYDGEPLTAGYTYNEEALAEGDTLKAVTEGSRTDAGSSANTIKSFTIERDGRDMTGNYDVMTSEGTLDISPRKLTFTSGSSSKVYDGTPLTYEEVITGGDGFAEGEGADFTFTGKVKDVSEGEVDNTFTWTLRGDRENYQIAEPVYGKLKVTPAPLTVKADDKEKMQGKDNPGLTYTIEGFAGDEGEDDALKGSVSLTTDAVKDSPAGEYTITASGDLEAVSGNYDISYEDGVLTVRAAAAAGDTEDGGPVSMVKTGDVINLAVLILTAIAAIVTGILIYRTRKLNRE